jgi:hypothetical protein
MAALSRASHNNNQEDCCHDRATSAQVDAIAHLRHRSGHHYANCILGHASVSISLFALWRFANWQLVCCGWPTIAAILHTAQRAFAAVRTQMDFWRDTTSALWQPFCNEYVRNTVANLRSLALIVCCYLASARIDRAWRCGLLLFFVGRALPQFAS